VGAIEEMSDSEPGLPGGSVDDSLDMFQLLFVALVDFAKEQLASGGDFETFGGLLDANNELSLAIVPFGDETNRGNQIMMLADCMRSTVAQEHSRAGAICAFRGVVSPDESDTYNAIVFHYEDQFGECCDYILPVEFGEDGQPIFQPWDRVEADPLVYY